MHVILANPRGFCAGVDRAIEIVEQALARIGMSREPTTPPATPSKVMAATNHL